MKIRIALVCVLGLVLGVMAPEAGAVSLFLQPPLDGQPCHISDYGWNQEVADNFALSGPCLTIDSVRWWGGYGADPDPSPSDSFAINFYADAAGSPAATAFASLSANNLTRTPTSMTAAASGQFDGGTVYEYYADLSSALTVSASTTYYLSIVNSTQSIWGWMEDLDGNHWWRQGSSSWSLSGYAYNQAFELLGPCGDIPEPATLLLMGMGVAGLAMRLRRR